MKFSLRDFRSGKEILEGSKVYFSIVKKHDVWWHWLAFLANWYLCDKEHSLFVLFVFYRFSKLLELLGSVTSLLDITSPVQATFLRSERWIVSRKRGQYTWTLKWAVFLGHPVVYAGYLSNKIGKWECFRSFERGFLINDDGAICATHHYSFTKLISSFWLNRSAFNGFFEKQTLSFLLGCSVKLCVNTNLKGLACALLVIWCIFCIIVVFIYGGFIHKFPFLGRMSSSNIAVERERSSGMIWFFLRSGFSFLIPSNSHILHFVWLAMSEYLHKMSTLSSSSCNMHRFPLCFLITSNTFRHPALKLYMYV